MHLLFPVFLPSTIQSLEEGERERERERYSSIYTFSGGNMSPKDHRTRQRGGDSHFSSPQPSFSPLSESPRPLFLIPSTFHVFVFLFSRFSFSFSPKEIKNEKEKEKEKENQKSGMKDGASPRHTHPAQPYSCSLPFESPGESPLLRPFPKTSSPIRIHILACKSK